MKDRDRSARISFAVLVACALVLSSSGCADRSVPDDSGVGQDQVTRIEAERESVRFEGELTPNPARFSDFIELTLRVSAPADVMVRMPPFGQGMAALEIRDFREADPEVFEGQRRLQHTYELEPASIGTHTLGPFTLEFSSNPDADAPQWQTIETPTITVEVETVVESDVPSLEDLETDAEPVLLPDQRPSVWWFVAGFVVLLGGVLATLWYFRPRDSQVVVQRSPSEVAYEQLQRLRDRDPLEIGIKTYFTELSTIVRTFIEGSTGVLAAEQTTEEFLRDPGTKELFTSADQQRLKGFLETADLVKFARMEPSSEVAQQAWQQAWDFVESRSVDGGNESVEQSE